MSKIGYARVSTNHQELAIQLEQLGSAGCEEIFHGKQSGTSSANEEKLAELVKYIRKGDVVFVTKLDRLGRSLKSILKTVDSIHHKGASLRSLDGVIDTTNDSPMAKAVINLLGTFAQLERDLITSRTREGRERAMAEGKVFGRKKSISDKDRKAIQADTSTSVSALAKKHDVSRTTIQRIKRESA